jgi:hypothetical protein
MSKKLIDNIFDYDSYRYVPQELKAEWKTLYNLYIGNYFKKQHEIYKIHPQNRIDFYNEEILRLDRLQKLCDSFLDKIENLQPKYNSDVEYSGKIKKSLKKSINKLNLFLKNKKDLVNKKVKINDIPLKKEIEHFNQCYDLDSASNNKIPIIVSIILIIVMFYITFYVE